MTTLELVIDTILPGDSGLGMPCASQVGIDTYLRQQGSQAAAFEFAQMVDRVCMEKFGLPFAQMDSVQRMQAIDACKRVDMRLFAGVVTHFLKAYYTSPEVLGKLQTGSVPPFPEGNSLPTDDWTLLGPVYERGPIYREISEEDPTC